MARFPDKTRLIDRVNQAHLGSRRHVNSGNGATVTLTREDADGIHLFDRAAGIVYTLPVAPIGAVFDFAVTVTITSNAAKVITGAATELLIGAVLSDDTDTSDALAIFPANGSTHISISCNGTTTGGLIGSWYRFTCLTTTKWLVQGVNNGSSTVANPFATS